MRYSFRITKDPAIKLMSLYDSLGIKSSFNIEVTQELTFLKYSSKVKFFYLIFPFKFTFLIGKEIIY